MARVIGRVCLRADLSILPLKLTVHLLCNDRRIRHICWNGGKAKEIVAKAAVISPRWRPIDVNELSG